MLDECITKKCAHAIIEYLGLYKPPVEAHFLLDFVKEQGQLDTGEERARLIISKMPDIISKACRSRGGERYKIVQSAKGVLIKPWPLHPPSSRSDAPPNSD